jgi:NAD(P)-dependent dehydrogenase (short-subunit alcohol dehydrogenase family)/acyl dehydratase
MSPTTPTKNDEARDLTGADLRAGLTASFEREITAEDVAAFADLCGDRNPLHVDAGYAAETTYGRPIVHGAFQVALASAMAGMHLPGRRVLLGSARSRFPAPLYHPCTVQVQGEIVSWFEAARSGMLRVRVIDRASSTVTAEIHLGFSLHEARAADAPEQHVTPSAGTRDLVVVTGASGAVGGGLRERLVARFDVLGIARRAAPDLVACDLEGDDWESQASAAAGDRPVRAVVHAAWPGAPRGGLLDLEVDAIRRQLDFGGLVTIRLARWLARRAAGVEGRLVLVGSTAASLQPEIGLAGYSLGKAALEHAVRLLAPELARSRITVNAILPSYMPIGINRSKTERAALLETAKVPLGRLCTVDDIFAAVDYFLSPAASFVTGQLLPLTGGAL